MKGRELVEAALFISSEPLGVEKLSALSGLEIVEVRAAIQDLREGYSRMGSAIEVKSVGESSYLMKVKDSLSGQLAGLARPVLPQEPLKTLSYIALKQPVLQSEVVKARGEKAYAHVRALVEKGFISAQPQGRTKILATTEKFSSYFGLSRDIGEIKKEIGSMLQGTRSSLEG